MLLFLIDQFPPPLRWPNGKNVGLVGALSLPILRARSSLHFFPQGILQSPSCINDSLLLALNIVLGDQHLLDVRLAGVDVDARVFLNGGPAAALPGDGDRVQVKGCRDALEHTFRRQFGTHTCAQREIYL